MPEQIVKRVALVHAANFCEVHDVASRNGTLVNGRKIAGPTRLRSGDEISTDGKTVGTLTSAAVSGDGETTVALAPVSRTVEVGNAVEVDSGDGRRRGQVVPLPMT